MVYGSVISSQLDQQVVNRILCDHLNNHMLPDLLKNMNSDTQSPAPPAVSAGHQTRDVPAAQEMSANLTCDRDSDIRSTEAAHTLLLHSLPTRNITLNLQLSSTRAIGDPPLHISVCMITISSQFAFNIIIT